MNIPQSLSESSLDPLFLNIVTIFDKVINSGVWRVTFIPFSNNERSFLRFLPMQPLLKILLIIPLGSVVLLFFKVFRAPSSWGCFHSGDLAKFDLYHG